MGRPKGSKSSKAAEAAPNVTPEKEKLIDRINALLNTAAEGSGATEAERDTALQLAVSIMRKYAIEEGELRLGVTESDIEHRVYPAYIVNKFEVKEWRRWIAHGVAKAFMVQSYNLGSDQFIFAGRSADIDIAEQVYTSLRNQMQIAVDAAAKASLKEGRHGYSGAKGGLDPYAWRKQFLEAAARRLYERLEELAAASTEDVEADNVPADERDNVFGAIVLVNTEAIEKHMAQHFGPPVKSNGRKHNRGAFNADAILMGRKAADDAHISNGISGGTEQPAGELRA